MGCLMLMVQLTSLTGVSELIETVLDEAYDVDGAADITGVS
jgi:hypothetical protein